MVEKKHEIVLTTQKKKKKRNQEVVLPAPCEAVLEQNGEHKQQLPRSFGTFHSPHNAFQAVDLLIHQNRQFQGHE